MSAPAQTELSVQQFLTKNGMTPRAPPSLVTRSQSCPKQFFLLLLKKVLKGKRFADVEDRKQTPAEALKGIKIKSSKTCFEQWKKHLDRCVASNGEYFEGD